MPVTFCAWTQQNYQKITLHLYWYSTVLVFPICRVEIFFEMLLDFKITLLKVTWVNAHHKEVIWILVNTVACARERAWQNVLFFRDVLDFYRIYFVILFCKTIRWPALLGTGSYIDGQRIVLSSVTMSFQIKMMIN